MDLKRSHEAAAQLGEAGERWSLVLSDSELGRGVQEGDQGLGLGSGETRGSRETMHGKIGMKTPLLLGIPPFLRMIQATTFAHMTFCEQRLRFLGTHHCTCPTC